MTEFKQIIGRGTRISEKHNKQFFTIIDFRSVTNKFADPDFDGDNANIVSISKDKINIDPVDYNGSINACLWPTAYWFKIL